MTLQELMDGVLMEIQGRVVIKANVFRNEDSRIVYEGNEGIFWSDVADYTECEIEYIYATLHEGEPTLFIELKVEED